MMKPVKLKQLSALAMVILVGIGACAENNDQRSTSVQFTEYGLAHVTSESFEGAGYGYGWAYARDNLCLAVGHAITLAAERSVRLGADESYFDMFANLRRGGEVSNFDSDVFYKAHLTPERVEKVKEAASTDLRNLVRGYARGIRAHIDSTPLPGETCRDEPWFRAIDEEDIWRRAVHIPIIQTSNMFLFDLTSTELPTGDEPEEHITTPIIRETGGGSNAAAFGRDITDWGGGMSFANPHYAWRGPQRFHAGHLKVGEDYNLFGAMLYNFPVPLIGFNETMGWSITYVTDKRIVAYELELDPQSPTRYRIGDGWEDMVPVEVEIPIKSESGTEVRRKTLWKTRYGFVLSGAGLQWTVRRAYALSDPQLDNYLMGDQYLDISKATTARAVKESLGTIMGAPWSNIVAADSSGEVFYGNFTQTPGISEETLDACQRSTYIGDRPALFKALGIVVNGSDPNCVLVDGADGTSHRFIPAEDRPFALRTDFLHHSNDSHWLPGWDASSALEGYHSLIGDERTIRGERTRIGAMMALGRRDGSDGLGAPGIDAQRWEMALFQSRNLMADLLVDEVVEDCLVNRMVEVSSESARQIDLTEACEALRNWDRTGKPDARGSILFREFVNRLKRKPSVGFRLEDQYWRTPFDPDDPINTPTGFVVSAETRHALADAVIAMETAGFPVNASVAEVQTTGEGDDRLPIGGSSFTYDLVITSLTENGGSPIIIGHSYVHIVELDGNTPRGRYIVPFSQSTNPSSPHYNDMTRVFSDRKLIDIVFSPEDIAASQVHDTIILPY